MNLAHPFDCCCDDCYDSYEGWHADQLAHASNNTDDALEPSELDIYDDMDDMYHDCDYEYEEHEVFQADNGDLIHHVRRIDERDWKVKSEVETVTCYRRPKQRELRRVHLRKRPFNVKKALCRNLGVSSSLKHDDATGDRLSTDEISGKKDVLTGRKPRSRNRARVERSRRPSPTC